MPLINQSLPNMIQGISQQPSSTRYEGQCEDMLNAHPSIVRGLTKRPYIAFDYMLEESAANIGPLDEDVFVHFIKTREDEKYILVYDGTKLRVYNQEDGTLCDISRAGSGSGAYTVPSGDYLDLYGTSPKERIRAVTAGDTTFLLNKNVIVGLNQNRTDSRPEKALVFIKQADYAKTYSIRLEGGVDGSISVGTQAQITVSLKKKTGRYPWWFVDGVSVTNQGAGYEDGKITAWMSSDRSILRQPSFNFTVVGGAIQNNVEIVEAGRIEAKMTDPAYPSFAFSLHVSAPTADVGVAGVNYVVASYTTQDSNEATTIGSPPLYEEAISPEHILGQLKQNLISYLGTSVTNFSISMEHLGTPHNLLRIERNAVGGVAPEIKISVTDEFNGRGIGLLHKKAESISDLPRYCENGFIIEIKGDEDESSDDYWVTFRTNNGEDYGYGVWEETVAPNVSKGLDNTTLPITLKLVNKNTFVLEEMPLTERLAGDEVTNPNPSVDTLPLTDIFLFKDRLGFIAENNVLLTESGIGPVDNGILTYNFFRSTVTTSLDSERIDLAVTSTKTVELERALPIQDRLLLFANGQQFVFRGGDILTGATAEASPTTSFDMDDKLKPFAIGESLLFSFSRSPYAGIREYIVDIDAEVYLGPEITEQIPRLLPSDIHIGAGSTTERVAAFVSPSRPNEMWVNSSHVSNNQKVLNSWGRHNFPLTIRGLNFDESTLNIVGNYDRLKTIPANLSSFAINSVTKADPYVYELSLTFDAAHGLSIGDYIQLSGDGWTHTESAGGSYKFRIKEDNTVEDGARLQLTNVVGNTIYFEVEKKDIESYALAPFQPMPTVADFVVHEVSSSAVKVSMNFQSDSEDVAGFNTYLDMRTKIVVAEGDTSITLPYEVNDETNLKMVDLHTGSLRQEITSASGNTVNFLLPYANDSELLVGFTFQFKYKFNEYVFKLPASGQAVTPTNSSPMMIRNGSVYFTKTGPFDVEVTPAQPSSTQRAWYETVLRPTQIFTFDPTNTAYLGTEYFGNAPLADGMFRFPVRCKPDDAVIEIKARNYTPLSLQSAEFESYVNARSDRFRG